MELILISESKLKIMLTRPDMEHYELESDGMDCANAHTRAAFRHIFDDARAEVGFDTAGAPLFVQLYASPEGGCEIFVTKLEGEEKQPTNSVSDSENSSLLPSPSAGERRLLERVRNQKDSRFPFIPHERYIAAALAFSVLEDLLSVCRRLCGAISARSHVYREETSHGTVWYLLLEDGESAYPPFIAEYGLPLPAKGIWDYLSEHGIVIRNEDAVEVLGKM